MYRANYIADARNINKVLLAALVIFSLSIFSIFFRPATFLDVIVCLLLFAGLSLYSKKRSISTGAFLIVSFAITMHLLGSLGLYSRFIYGFLGFDKIVHFTSSFSVAYLVFESFPKNMPMRYATAFLVVMGLGSLVEINEFIGSHYFGINNAGIFTISDALPSIKSDLQRFDTHFDMIFNLIGSIASLVFIKARLFSKNMSKNSNYPYHNKIDSNKII